MFVEEALRLEPPFRYHMRHVANDTALGGVEIPVGATVILLWGAANRDAAMFDHPESIDLTREAPRRHVAFGRGIHHCVGAPLARVEARNVLSVLLARTSDITLDTQRQPRWVNSLMVRRHEELPVRLTASRGLSPKCCIPSEGERNRSHVAGETRSTGPMWLANPLRITRPFDAVASSAPEQARGRLHELEQDAAYDGRNVLGWTSSCSGRMSAMATVEPAAESRRSEGWEKRRERIGRHIELTALELIATEGPENVTVERIAVSAGISNRTFFRYFSTRDDVISALPQRLVEDLCLRLAARPTSESVLEAFTEAVRGTQDAPIDQALVLAWGQARRQWPMEAPRSGMVATYQRVIAERMGTPVEDVRVEVMAVTIGSMMWVVFLRWLASNGSEPLITILEKSLFALAELSDHADLAARTLREPMVKPTAR
jgi:AcrR family transcriptional regulator